MQIYTLFVIVFSFCVSFLSTVQTLETYTKQTSGGWRCPKIKEIWRVNRHNEVRRTQCCCSDSRMVTHQPDFIAHTACLVFKSNAKFRCAWRHRSPGPCFVYRTRASRRMTSSLTLGPCFVYRTHASRRMTSWLTLVLSCLQDARFAAHDVIAHTRTVLFTGRALRGA